MRATRKLYKNKDYREFEEKDLNLEKEKLEQLFADSMCECGRTERGMFYQCEKCESIHLVWLERGLEEHNGKFHKPVPFTDRCPICGGLMKHTMWNNDIMLNQEIPLPRRSLYFANKKKEKCGVLSEVE